MPGMRSPGARSGSPTGRIVFAIQVASVSMIWMFVVGISVWIVNLILLAIDLHDVPGASLGISVVAIPVFITLAGVLTYVFVGLQRENRKLGAARSEDQPRKE